MGNEKWTVQDRGHYIPLLRKTYLLGLLPVTPACPIGRYYSTAVALHPFRLIVVHLFMSLTLSFTSTFKLHISGMIFPCPPWISRDPKAASMSLQISTSTNYRTHHYHDIDLASQDMQSSFFLLHTGEGSGNNQVGSKPPPYNKRKSYSPYLNHSITKFLQLIPLLFVTAMPSRDKPPVMMLLVTTASSWEQTCLYLVP